MSFTLLAAACSYRKRCAMCHERKSLDAFAGAAPNDFVSWPDVWDGRWRFCMKPCSHSRLMRWWHASIEMSERQRGHPLRHPEGCSCQVKPPGEADRIPFDWKHDERWKDHIAYKGALTTRA